MKPKTISVVRYTIRNGIGRVIIQYRLVGTDYKGVDFDYSLSSNVGKLLIANGMSYTAKEGITRWQIDCT